MIREGLRYELTGAFQKALQQKETVVLAGLKVATSGEEQFVNVTLHSLEELGPLHVLVMIVFTDVPAPMQVKVTGQLRKSSSHSPRLAELERALQIAREETRTRREEMQTSQEELRSTNEEMQSSNAELQSTNEELTTSKEEMQSLNEELQTVNTELQAHPAGERARASRGLCNRVPLSTEVG